MWRAFSLIFHALVKHLAGDKKHIQIQNWTLKAWLLKDYLNSKEPLYFIFFTDSVASQQSPCFFIWTRHYTICHWTSFLQSTFCDHRCANISQYQININEGEIEHMKTLRRANVSHNTRSISMKKEKSNIWKHWARIFMLYHAKYVYNYVTETSEIRSKICGFINICNIT
jgi:hypothetical protein